MKKIAAFVTALALFVVCIIAFHYYSEDRIATNNPNFGTWISKEKDLSYEAVKANTHEDTVLMLGSSEFQHGRKTPYHPSWIFRRQNMDVMCIGAAYNQSLSHTITLASIAPELKSKKVVLLLSPSWFNKHGVKEEAFSIRFSESQYIAMMENPHIKEETKAAVTERVLTLLARDKEMKKRVQKYRDVYLGSGGILDRIFLEARKKFVREKEIAMVSEAWIASGQKNYKKYEPPAPVKENPDWAALEDRAEVEYVQQPQNRFHMIDKFYREKIVPRMKDKRQSDLQKSYGTSPEYGDLRLFLDVCRQENVDICLVLLPVNGYWYDYTGFPREGRQQFVKKVENIAQEYNVETCNLFNEGYTPGFLEDAVHPAGKGWVRINEEVYKFFRQGKTSA